MKVLIADDSPIVRERLADLLHQVAGVEVVAQAENGTRALEMMRSLQPDVAIIDLRMPGRSGVDLLGEVRTGWRSPTIIVLTNYCTPENREKCLALGADYFLDKSNEVEKVIGVLQELMQGNHGQRH
jgi:DNA-binding NarL/FixJ family response regulator